MSATLGVSSAIDSALRRAFSDASVRLKPETKISDLVTALGTLGVSVEVTEDGVLILSQGVTQMHTTLALRSLTSKPEFQKFFIISTADPKTWSQAEKQAYIRKNGADAFGKLCCAPVLRPEVRVMDPNMSRADYENLTTAERVAFIREFGSDAVSRIMRKAKQPH